MIGSKIRDLVDGRNTTIERRPELVRAPNYYQWTDKDVTWILVWIMRKNGEEYMEKSRPVLVNRRSFQN